MSDAMAGGGVYDCHSEYQMRDGLSHTELIGDAANKVEIGAERRAVVIADYGCAQGRVSNPLIRTAVEHVRAQDQEIPICVYHNDLMANDWAALFDRLTDEESYLRSPGGPITPLASATSFYDPVTPPGIVDLGLSFAAVQWLATPGPTDAGTALYFDQLEGATRDAIAVQAEADWSRFLERRADELAPGGRIVLDMMGVADDGVAAGHDAWLHVRSVCEGMVGDDLIDADRLDDYVVPIYERSADEAARPFDGEIGDRLALEALELRPAPNPYIEQFRQDGDAAALARAFTGFFRAFSEPSLRQALGLSDDAVDELYDRLASTLQAAAAEFSFEIHTLNVVISRRD